MNSKLFFIPLVVIAIVILGFLGCEGNGSQYANIPPMARLANIPPPDRVTDLKNPRLTLYWVGDDADGFVTAFKYRWSYTITENNQTTTYQKSWKTLLNIMWGSGASALALMLDTAYQNSEIYTTKVYKYFANLDPSAEGTSQGLPIDVADGLLRGDTVLIEGIRVYASNPDSIIDQSTIDPTSPNPLLRRGLRMVKRYPEHVNPNSGTFIFDSQDSVNYHVFQISAVDNLGSVGTAATVRFNTFNVPPPSDSISMNTEDTLYVIDKITDTFTGIHVTFWGNDPNSRTIEYQWVVDRDRWPEGQVPWSKWSERAYADITAKDLYDPYATEHTFYLRARNEFGSINTLGYFTYEVRDSNQNIVRYDTTWSHKTFYTLYPEFAKTGYTKRILLLNHSYEVPESDSDAAHPTYPKLIEYWTKLMDDAGVAGKYDVWSTKKQNYPTFEMFTKYSTVVLFADILSPDSKWYAGSISSEDTNTAIFGGKANRLIGYCRIGGNIIWSSRNLGMRLNTAELIHSSILHGSLLITDEAVQAATRDSVGLIGANANPLVPFDGYIDVMFDSTKLAPLGGYLGYNYYADRIGMGERFYSYVHRNPSSTHANQNIGIRYAGSTFKSIYFGFPLYYIRYADAVVILRTALRDVGEE